MSGAANPRNAGGMVQRLSSASAVSAANYLTLPTPDGSGQMVHPDVIDFGSGNTWNGWRYWMAITPYTNTDATTENPCILVSNDKTTWQVPNGLTNPVIPFPGVGKYNADTDIIMVGSTMYMIWKYTDANDEIRLATSTDGVTWTTQGAILTAIHDFCLSPGVAVRNGRYVMISINHAVTPNTIERRTSTSMASGWSTPQTVTIPSLGGGDGWWHINITYDGDVLYAIITSVNYNLYLAASFDDGLNWTIAPNAILPKLPGTWQANLYRSCILRTATGFDLWYSAHNGGSPATWRTGYTTVVMP